jgi:hypothetical protein
MKRLLVFTSSSLYDPASRIRGKNIVDSLCKHGLEAVWYPYEKPKKPIPEFLHVAKDFIKKVLIVRDSCDDTGVLIQRSIAEYESLRWNAIKYLSRLLRGMPKFTFLSFSFGFLSKFVLKRRLVYDIDDALFLESPLEVSLLLKVSDIVLVGGHELYNYARRYNKNVRLMPTCIDAEKVPRSSCRKNDGPVVLGFVGSPSTTIFLSELLTPLTELAKTQDFEVVVASAHRREEYKPYDWVFEKFREKNIKIQPLLWDLQTENQIMENIDVGLAPLPNREWERYKCGFKVINYMAAGIPPVASAVGEHKFIIRDGVDGFLCRTSADWTCKLKKLIEDSKFRESMGNNARKTVESRYSLKRNTEELVRLLSSA